MNKQRMKQLAGITESINEDRTSFFMDEIEKWADKSLKEEMALADKNAKELQKFLLGRKVVIKKEAKEYWRHISKEDLDGIWKIEKLKRINHRMRPISIIFTISSENGNTYIDIEPTDVVPK